MLSERRDEIAGRVLFMFQPGEEGHHGAKHMLDEGLLDVPPMSDGTESTGGERLRDPHDVGAAERLGVDPWRRR